MITHRLVVSYTTFSPLPALAETRARRSFSSAVTNCHQLLLLSEVGHPVLPGLSSRALRHQRQAGAVLSGRKITKKS